MTKPVAVLFHVGQSVTVVDCPDHKGQVGEVIDVYGRQLRIEFPNGRRCWPRHVEALVNQKEPPDPLPEGNEPGVSRR